mmetsp:Transcript_8303/g.14236  ORF Transcript_8303/g.14236 Transcript_8303/m.14236 type:complete len:108 (-) Transcript_8303:119-442(-)
MPVLDPALRLLSGFQPTPTRFYSLILPRTPESRGRVNPAVYCGLSFLGSTTSPCCFVSIFVLLRLYLLAPPYTPASGASHVTVFVRRLHREAANRNKASMFAVFSCG